MKNCLKIIGIILIILIVIFAIHTIRNYVIITNLQNKIGTYINSDNYFIESSTKQGDAVSMSLKCYKKGNKQVTFLDTISNSKKTLVSAYSNGEKNTVYTEADGLKEVNTNIKEISTVSLHNYLETDNNWQTFINGISANVKSTTVNGKDCYLIKGFMSSTGSASKDIEVYVEKDTGLLLKVVDGDSTTESGYEFNNVDDSIFVEPDVSQYTVKE